MTTAADTERRRQEWVQAELVKAGTERARSLGWTDVYTFTKALGERVVADVGAGIQVSVVRPAIVESSWRHPYPGWIEGFKMAEPLILAYGRGELPEFPASPDAVIDIVPCDHVVNAILAVCATEPEVGTPRYYHVNSGARNPLTFRDIYGHVRSYFTAHPFEGGVRGVTRLPQWEFPGATSVERLLSTSERAHSLAERVLGAAPRSNTTRKFARDLDRARVRLDFLRRYLSLYNEYAQSELHFVDDNTLALTNSLHADDQPIFAFDTAVFDWTTYIEEVHCPSITAPIRRMDALRRKRGARPSTMKDLSKDTAGRQALAIFDLDGTIMSTNVIEQYLWARLPELSPARQLAEVGRVLRKLPSYLRAERRDRGTFLRAVYRRYAGADLAALEEFVDTTLAAQILSRMSPEAVRRIREHRNAGHTTILITGRGAPADPPAGTAVRRDRGRRPGHRRRRPVHRIPDRATAGWGVPRRLAATLRRRARCRSRPQLRLRRLPFRSADAVGGRPGGRRQSRHRLDAGRQRQPVVERGVEDQADHAALVATSMNAASMNAASMNAASMNAASMNIVATRIGVGVIGVPVPLVPQKGPH